MQGRVVGPEPPKTERWGLLSVLVIRRHKVVNVLQGHLIHTSKLVTMHGSHSLISMSIIRAQSLALNARAGSVHDVRFS